MMEEDYFEKTFEDDIDDISEGDSDGEDYLAESIARLKSELQNDEYGESSQNTIDQHGEWSELMESVKLNSIKLEDSGIIAATPVGEEWTDTAKIVSQSADPAPPHDLLACVERLDEVRDILFAMIESVEYISSIAFEQVELQQPAEDCSPGLQHTREEPTEVTTHYVLTDFEENTVAAAVERNEPEDDSTLLYDDLMHHESEHKKKLQLALEAMELQMAQKSDECRRAVEDDRRLREERRARIAEQALQIAKRNKAATAIQARARGLIMKTHYFVMLKERQRLREGLREREERQIMSKNDMFSRAAWDYLRQCELALERVEISRREVDRKGMDTEDVLGGLMRVEVLREERNRQAMTAADAESMASKEIFDRLTCLLREEEEARVRKEREQEEAKKRLAEKELLRKKQENEASVHTNPKTVGGPYERLFSLHNALSEKMDSRSVDSMAGAKGSATATNRREPRSGGARASLSERQSSSGWGGSVPSAAPKAQVPECRRVNAVEVMSSLSLVLPDDSGRNPTVAPGGPVNGHSDMTSNEVESDIAQPPINPTMMKFINDIARDAIARCQLPVEFKSSDTADDAISRAQAPYTLQEAAFDIYEYVMSMRHRQSHEKIVIAWESWKMVCQGSDISSLTVKSRLRPSRCVLDSKKRLPESVSILDENDAFLAAQGHADSFSGNLQVQDYRNEGTVKTKTTELKMSVEGLTDIGFIKNYPNLITLDLNVNRIVNLDTLAGRASLLEELYLKDNALICIKGLSHLASLRVLNLEANQLTDLSPLEKLPNLVHLSANMNRLSAVPVLTSPHLQKLELYHNRICSLSPNCLKHLVSLTHLDLGRNKLCTVSGEALSKCQLLSQLVLSQNQLSDVPHPLYLPNLRNLWLSGNKLCDLSKWTRRGQPPMDGSWPVFLPLLERLYLQDNTIGTVDEDCFASSPFLSEVDLSFNSIRSIQDLSGVLECPLTRVLHLQDNPVNSDVLAMQYVRSLLSELKELSGHAVGAAKPAEELDDEDQRNGDKYMHMIVTAQRHCGWGRALIRNEEKNKKRSRITFPLASFWKQRSCQVRDLIHFLSGLLSEQNVSRTWERSASSQQDGQLGRALKRTPFVDVLRSHCDLLLAWNADGGDGHLVSIRCPPAAAHCLASSDGTSAGYSSSGKSSHRRGSKEAQALQSARCTHAALTIQSLVRGWNSRRRLKRILHSAVYMDEELEAMFGEGDGLAEYEGFLGKIAPELEDGWLQPLSRDASRCMRNCEYEDEGDEVEHGAAVSSAGSEGSFVYGDHRRRRHPNLPSSAPQADEPSARMLKPTTPTEPSGRTSPRGGQVAAQHRGELAASYSGSIQGTDLQDAGVYINTSHQSAIRTPPSHREGGMEGSRGPQSFAATDTSSRPASQSSNLSSASSRFGLGNYDMEEDADMLLHTARSRASDKSEQAAEWGISDPTVVQAMMKRNKRMKHFQEAKERREMEKDPNVRFQKFMKSAAPAAMPSATKGNTNVSGSFGGKPKRIRNTTKKKSAAPPAWMVGSDFNEDAK